MGYSKIRHIRNSNIILENRFLLNEQKIVDNIDLGNGFVLEIRKYNGADPKKPLKSHFKIFFKTPLDYYPPAGEVGAGEISATPEIWGVKISPELEKESLYGYPTLEDAKKIANDISTNDVMKRKIQTYILKKGQKKPVGKVAGSELVTNKNPFNYEEYSKARISFSPNLKNGDLFTEWANNAVDLILEKINDSLNGKTIKYLSQENTQSTITFGIDSNKATAVNFNKNFGEISSGKPVIKVINFYAVNNSIGPGDFRINFETNTYEYSYPDRQDAFGKWIYRWASEEIKSGTWQSNLFNYIKQNFQDIKKYSDDLFMIEKISDEKTDF